MRFLLIMTAALLSLSVSGAAQQKTFRVKPSSPEVKTGHKNVPADRVPATSTQTARDLKTLEHQTAKTVPVRTPKAPRKQSVALKPEKEKSNPPMNFGKGQGSASGVKQGSNAYKGRLKQKHGSH